MPTSMPGAVDTFTNPAATDSLAGHAAQHTHVNDALKAVEQQLYTPGDIVIYPGQLTQALVTAAGIGATFLLKAGTHGYTAGVSTPTITPLAGQTFIGEPAAILDGGMIKNTATVVAGTVGSTLIVSGYTFAAGTDDQTGTTPTWVSGFAFNNNAAALITAVVSGTTATLGNDSMAWTRSVTDGVTNSTTTLTSATAGFVANDVGADVNGTGIPANTTIASVTNGTTVVLSAAATATASGVTIKLTQHRRGTSRTVTDAVTTNTGTTVTSAALGLFTIQDVGASVTGTGIPANTSILSISAAPSGTTASSIVLNNAATASGTITLTVQRQTSRVVTLTRPPAAGIDAAFKGTAANVTIRNMIIQNYATVTGRAAIHPQTLDDATSLGNNWIIEGCEIRYNASAGMRSCDNAMLRYNRIHDNGDVGQMGAGHNVLFEGNEVYYNNAYNIPAGFDACGLKFATTTGLIVRRNRVHDNLGLGIWTDVDCFGTIIENNDVYFNNQHGISIETCYNTKVRYNTVYGNGLANSAGSFYDPGNILVTSSSNVEVHDNTVGNLTYGNYHGIGVLAQDRKKVTSGGLRTVADMVTNGTTTITSATAAFTQADRNAQITGTNMPGGPPVTTIISITNATTAVLSVAASGSGSGGTLNIQKQLDQYGSLPGTGQATASGWYQRTYNVEVHHNNVTTTGTAGVELAGLASDIGNAAAAGYWLARGVRFHSNIYNYTDGGAYFGWSSGAFVTMAQWQAFGMDQVQTQLAPSGYTPTTEAIQQAPDVMGTQWRIDALKSTQVSNITGAVTIDLSTGLHQRLTLTGNVTSLTISNVPYQGEVILEFIQDATGSRTRVNTGTNMKPAGAALGTQTATALKTDIYTFVCDGTNITERCRSLNC